MSNGELNLEAVGPLVESQVKAGVAGVVVAGSSGEFLALTLDERRQLAEEVVRSAAGRLTVVVQTGTHATRDTLDLTAHAARVGADGVLVATPFGDPLTWSETRAFWTALDAAGDLSAMIYHIEPAGLLTVDQVAQLSELETVTALKESSYDMLLLGDLVAWATEHGDFDVYGGADTFTEDAVRAGAIGTLTGVSNFLGAELSALLARVWSGEGATKEGREFGGAFRGLARFLETASTYVGLVKLGCADRGLEVGPVRAPHQMPSAQEADTLERLVGAVARAYAALPPSADGAAAGAGVAAVQA